ncbi:hypothetical protein RN69_07045 [Bradyrhizobium japonicum]|jgi:hypothetical protein|nr:hypothetical protein RN69_07045 [Bradyrhizobium japonicum]
MSGVIKASRQAPGRAELHTRSTEAKGLDDDARLDKNGALRDRFVGGVLFLNGRLSEKPGVLGAAQRRVVVKGRLRADRKKKPPDCNRMSSLCRRACRASG